MNHLSKINNQFASLFPDHEATTHLWRDFDESKVKQRVWKWDSVSLGRRAPRSDKLGSIRSLNLIKSTDGGVRPYPPGGAVSGEANSRRSKRAHAGPDIGRYINLRDGHMTVSIIDTTSGEVVLTEVSIDDACELLKEEQ